MQMKDKCINCGAQAEHYHHVIPRSLGGTDDKTNLVPLCNYCHGKLHGIEFTNGKLSHSELTRLGLERARQKGKRIGIEKGTKLVTKKSVIAKEIIKKYSVDFNGALKDSEVMKICGIARNTYYKYKREIREQIVQLDESRI